MNSLPQPNRNGAAPPTSSATDSPRLLELERLLNSVLATLALIVDRMVSRDYIDDALLRPLIRSLLEMRTARHDTCSGLSVQIQGADGDRHPYLKRMLELYEYDLRALDNLLERYGVESFQTPQRSPFECRLHHAVESTLTNDPARNGKVAKSLRPGFRHAGAVVQPELVRVFRLEEK